MTADTIKTSVIFLAGYGKSGTTLLDLIFNGHKEIFGAGGLGAYKTLDPRKMNRHIAQEDKPCTCGVMVSACPFWTKVFLPQQAKHGLGVFINPLSFLLNRKKYVHHDGTPVEEAEYIKENEDIYLAISRHSGKPYIFDSSRIPHRISFLAKSSKLDVTILHVVRNGAACLASDRKKRPNGFLRPMLGWLRANIEVEIIRRRHPKLKYIFLRYEDFVENPPRELTRILGTLGLQFSPDMLQFRTHESHNFSGNAHRNDPGQSEEIKFDNSWKKRISKPEIFVFNILAGWLNIAYARRATTDRKKEEPSHA